MAASPAGIATMIDIDRLNEAELMALNHRVVARLKFLQQMRAHAQPSRMPLPDQAS